MPIEVLPVMDLKAGQAVHARAGQRHEYQPLRSVWSPRASDPLALAEAIQAQFGVTRCYVADLDALEGAPPQWELIGRLIRNGLSLWLDAAIRTPSEADFWFRLGVDRLIVASETIPSSALLPILVSIFGPERLVFSLDLYRGVVRQPQGAFPTDDPATIVELVMSTGIDQILVLDTAAVGSGQGPVTGKLCRSLHERHPTLHLLTGGGVRNVGDLGAFSRCGVRTVLLSTALHRDQDFAPHLFTRSLSKSAETAGNARGFRVS